MRRSLSAALLCLALIGCAGGPESQLLGHWTGGYIPEVTEKRGAYSGYLHFYQNNCTFKMELKGKYQTLTATGEWAFEKGRVVLRTKDVQSDQPSADEIAALKAYFIEVDEVRQELGRETILKLSPEQALVGLSLHLGKVPGRLEFRHAERGAFEQPTK